ncbi:alpha/beta fold hydrolase [Chloroflexus sp.]|uniref:alpha/beta fold hydrolase n=1 Tax=Chloroflexus sp. TaxID=1904827 RepID=UPI002ADD72D1|nr:alpha/beta fold hydrolase [Chloroflexus sp.]
MHVTLPHGVQLRYDDAGSGQPVVLLHAFPLSAALWRAQLSTLSDRMRMIAPDLRGFGGSLATPLPQSLDDYATDVLALLDTLNIERAVLAGLSMGGYIAFALLRRAPERISGLLLADTRATADSEETRAARAVNARIALEEGSAALAGRMLLNLVAPGASEALRAELLSIAAANPPEGIAAALHTMAARPDSTPLLAEIRVPTTVVVGAEDTLTPPAEAQVMHSAIADSRFVVIPHAGHLSAIERPAEFNLALVELVMRVEAASRP